MPKATSAGEISSSCGGQVCSAAQGRRAARRGETADSLPTLVRMRRPVALGGGGNPFTPNQRLAVTPWRGAPSSRHEPPRAARQRELRQAAATTASAAPPPPRPLHRRRFSARMVPALAISSSPCARPSQRARPKYRRAPRGRGCPRLRVPCRESPVRAAVRVPVVTPARTGWNDVVEPVACGAGVC